MRILLNQSAYIYITLWNKTKEKTHLNIIIIIIIIIIITYEGESISNQPNLFPVEIHLFFFGVIAL